MKKYLILLSAFTSIVIFISCSSLPFLSTTVYSPTDSSIRYTGRIDFSNPEIIRLSSAGAYMKFQFEGTECDLVLSDQGLYEGHGYISIEIDGKYKERIRVEGKSKTYKIAANLDDSTHDILICKATESANGFIDVEGIICEKLLPAEIIPEKKIEFIGNSITCGMGNDISGLPCGEGQWYDQHNAYWSYAPIAARELKTDWLLSSVSGIGIYRNWNSPGPVMPQVYDNLFLNTDSSIKWDASEYTADLISICLGTNDFSKGDGSYDRGPVDSTQYVNEYVKFIKHIRTKNQSAMIACLTSPMISGETGKRLKSFVEEVVSQIKQSGDDKIHLFEFNGSFKAGCSGHPDLNQHKEIASQVIPFYKKIMNWE